MNPSESGAPAVTTPSGPRTRPRIFYGWWIVAAGMGLHLSVGLSIYALQLFFTPITQAFGWSRAAMSGAFPLQRIEGSFATPIEGFLVDRFGPRIFMVAGAVIAGLGLIFLIFLSFINALWMFYAGILILNLGTGLCIGVPRTWAIVQWFKRLRGRALGIGATGGALIGPMLFIIVWLMDAVGWRKTFLIMGIVTWVLCIPLALVFRGRPQQYGYLPDGDPPQDIASPQSAVPKDGNRRGDSGESSMAVRQVLKNPTFWILTLIWGAQGMGTSALIVHQTPYFESIGFTRVQAVSVLAWFSILSVFGRFGGGWVLDYVDKRMVLAGILVCQCVAFLILANITAYWQALPFAFFYALAFGTNMPAHGVVLSSYFGPRNFGAIQGLSGAATVVSGVVAPILMGWIYDVRGSYVLAIYILMAFAAAAIPLTYFARPPRPPAMSPA